MGGTAISALSTVKLVDSHRMANPFLLTAAALALYTVTAAVFLRDAPGRTAPSEPPARRLAATLRLGITWQASALYAVAFGGYVAFSVYLPTYLKTGYGPTHADAANRMAGFVLLAVSIRPLGGRLSDRVGPARVLAWALAVVIAGALVQSFTPSLALLGTLTCLAMAAALGAGSGATFTFLALLAPPEKTAADGVTPSGVADPGVGIRRSVTVARQTGRSTRLSRAPRGLLRLRRSSGASYRNA